MAIPTIAAAAEQIRTRKLSPVELTEQCLAAIERLQPRLNAFITVTAELAREQAHAAEAEISKGHYRGRLHGVPIAAQHNPLATATAEPDDEPPGVRSGFHGLCAAPK